MAGGCGMPVDPYISGKDSGHLDSGDFVEAAFVWLVLIVIATISGFFYKPKK